MKSHTSHRVLLKLAIGSVLIAFVLHSKMVNFELVKDSISSLSSWCIAIVFIAISTLCCATRWYLLVRAQNLKLSFRKLLELTLIGNFFNAFMPGAIGGDVIKGWYTAGSQPQFRTKAVFTVLLDRMVGLAIIIFYSSFTLLFYTEWLNRRPELQVIAYCIWGFTVCAIGGAAIFYGIQVFRPDIFDKILLRLNSAQFTGKLFSALLQYRYHLPTIIASAILSASSMLSVNLFYKIQGDLMALPVSLSEYFFIVPLAITVSAVPLLPGGIGVGQIAFFTLFTWMQIPNPEQGSTLCTVIQIFNLLFNCIGAVVYVKYKHAPYFPPQQDLDVAMEVATTLS